MNVLVVLHRRQYVFGEVVSVIATNTVRQGSSRMAVSEKIQISVQYLLMLVVMLVYVPSGLVSYAI